MGRQLLQQQHSHVHDSQVEDCMAEGSTAAGSRQMTECDLDDRRIQKPNL